MFDYNITDDDIDRVSDIGVLFSSRPSSKRDCNVITRKAYKDNYDLLAHKVFFISSYKYVCYLTYISRPWSSGIPSFDHHILQHITNKYRPVNLLFLYKLMNGKKNCNYLTEKRNILLHLCAVTL